MAKRRKSKLKIHRKEFPRVREIISRGQLFYSVDCRKKGTLGKQETYSDLQKALDYAETVGKEQKTSGTESLNITASLRLMALECDRELSAFRKTIRDATTFYVAHLKEDYAKKNSKPLSESLDEFLKDKTDSTEKSRSKRTLDELKVLSGRLKKAFPESKIAQLDESDIRTLLKKEYSARTKKNIVNKANQFFRWTVKKGYRLKNPCEHINIHVPNQDEIVKLSAQEALDLMRKCESDFPELITYSAVCLFGGLRPNSEALGLTWENIYLNQKVPQIRILASTSKVKETRLFEIEENLVQWLAYYGKGKTGLIVPENLRQLTEALRISLGYKLQDENENGREWVPDCMRHSYASYWLAKHKDRYKLAEYMGTSLTMIKNHYKNVVSPEEESAFWDILPKPLAEAVELRRKSGKKLNASLLATRSRRRQIPVRVAPDAS